MEKLGRLFLMVVFFGTLCFFPCGQSFADESICSDYCSSLDCSVISLKKCEKNSKKCKKQCAKYCDFKRCVGNSSKKCEKKRKKFEKLTGNYFFPCEEPLSCEKTIPTRKQIDEAVDKALIGLKNPWGNVNDFDILITRIEDSLKCTLTDSDGASDFQEFLPAPSSGNCSETGIDYCGSGNSETSWKIVHTKSACLNEACCEHDKCYGISCVDGECYWTTQTQECDDLLMDACNDGCDLDIMGYAICRIAKGLDNNDNPDGYPECDDAASCGKGPEPDCAGQVCGGFESCNPGSGCDTPICGSLAEGGGMCVEGKTQCVGLIECDTSADCDDGLCFVDSCCGKPVCAPASAFCPDIGNNQTVRAMSFENSGEMTLGLPSL